ncbi:MAG: hypothetical protein HFH69_05940 [Lachnospiraceae bacterium]|nr:hypothetical protein [Lachnospiraceae bacterium]
MVLQKRMHLPFQEHFLWGMWEKRDISLDVGYSERENLAQMWFSYNGSSFHPFGDEEDLSGRIIKGMSKEMEHTFVDGMNQFIISIYYSGG